MDIQSHSISSTNQNYHHWERGGLKSFISIFLRVNKVEIYKGDVVICQKIFMKKVPYDYDINYECPGDELVMVGGELVPIEEFLNADDGYLILNNDGYKFKNGI